MKIFKFILFIIFSSSIGEMTFAQEGTLDLSYGDNGSVITNYNPALYLTYYSVIQPDDAVVMMGRYSSALGNLQIGLSRHMSDGNIDFEFGVNGLATVNLYTMLYGKSIVLQNDGKIVVTGYFHNNSSNEIGLLVARFNSNGDIDSTFGSNGIAIFYNNMEPFSAKIQPNEKILIGGSLGLNFALIQLNSDGSLDEDFGINGLTTTTIISEIYESKIHAIDIQEDSKIVASGYATIDSFNTCFCLVRYNSDGSIDGSFGNNGKVVTDIIGSASERIRDQSIQPDGKIVVIGSFGDNEVAIARYMTNGTLDLSFGTNGIVIESFGTYCLPSSMLLQPDNKIVIVGESAVPTNQYFIARFTETGNLDMSFNSSGFNMLSFGTSNNNFASVLSQQDGKLLATGYTQIGSNAYTVIARFNSNLLKVEDFDHTFNIYPNPTQGIILFDNLKYVFENVSVKNIHGQHLLGPIHLSPNESAIDLSSLQRGLYLLDFEKSGKIITKKIIKN